MKNKLKVLYATPECAPFAASGGLGEVAGSLPRSLNYSRSANIECRVIMPLYGKVAQEYRDKMKFLGTTTVNLAWRSQYMGLFELRHDRVTYYFIDNEYYFKRDGLYGYYDDGERFAYFSKAVFEALPLMKDFVPDVIHANDWQTALIPVYQNSLYRREFMKTVFSIHNIEYQGYYGTEFLQEVVGLPESESRFLIFGNGINLMKGGIECCNMLNTVSPSYAEELKDPGYAFGMEDIVRRNEHKMRGILNGINTKTYDPAKDKLIPANYSARDISGKAICKKELQQALGLPESDSLMITLISRLVPAKGLDLVRAIMDEVLDQHDVQFVVLGTGYREYEDYFRGLEIRHPDKVRALIQFNSELSHRIYAGGDVILVPSRSEPCGLTQMIGCRYADVPVVRETGGLKDSIQDCTLGSGNGFVFSKYHPDDLRTALEHAIALYEDKKNWKKLIIHDLKEDFSWNASAKEYADMYHSMFSEEE